MPCISEGRLSAIVRLAVLAMGGSDSAADEMVASLISANMEGMDSHGVMRLPMYRNEVEKGLINPKAVPQVIKHDRAISIVDGQWCFGQVGAFATAREAVRNAREHGMGGAGLLHVRHIGRLKTYVDLVARQGMIAIAFCNSGPAGGFVVPYRGSQRRLGTNPLAVAVPRLTGEPLVADFATSVVAEGKLKLAVNTHHPVDPGTIIAKDGCPTTDPNDFYAGGALLPFARHKGYCLSLFIDIMGGLFVGSGCAALVHHQPGNGLFVIAIDGANVRPQDVFLAELEELLAVMKETPSAPGEPPVLLPGEPESLARAERAKTGVPIDDEAWRLIKEMGAKLSLPAELFDLVPEGAPA